MIRTLLTITALLWAGVSAAACDPGDTQGAIAHLLEQVRTSDAAFIRNGRTHDAQGAARHIERKYEHFRDRIDTPETFIALAATRSELSGREYRVRLADGTELASAEWLGAMLERWRAECEAGS